MFIADLHIHSRYSRATSKDCDAPHLDFWARRKGVQLVGTGDFTHPAWREELREMLEPAEEGLYALKKRYRISDSIGGANVRFMVTGEISTIYKKDGKTRKVHHLILLPSLEAAEELSRRLEAVGNIRSDGRPILGLDSRDLLEMTLSACPEAVFIPAHVWTPHFSLFGAFSDFSYVSECYGDLSTYIHALETGLSSDPPMNRRVSMLDKYNLVSNSDAHSPTRLAREANILDCAMSYNAVKSAIETGEGLYGTIEFFPEEGKYHLDGHRNCGICLSPEETAALGGRCPVCGKKLTVGVEHRISELADRADIPGGIMKPFESLVPLNEVLGDCMGLTSASKRVQSAYDTALNALGSELHILRKTDLGDIRAALGDIPAEAIRRLRAGNVMRSAGFDGQYGRISLFRPGEIDELRGQISFGIPVPDIKPKAIKIAETDVSQQSADVELSSDNPEQAEAINSSARAIAVIAGPGTGKTYTLVSRIAHLILEKGVKPTEITAVTFTRHAAEELRTRLEGRLGGKRAIKGLTVGTFHSVCMELLPKKPFVGRALALSVIRELLKEANLKLEPAQCLEAISARRNGVAVLDLPEGIVEKYRARLSEIGVRDLDDLIEEALDVDITQMPMFRNIFIDEYQDINAAQRRLVEKWAVFGGSVFAIGDPDQSIYGFRGASADCFEGLSAVLPDMRTIKLTRSYRSTPQILSAAVSVIDRNPGARRIILPTRADGARVRVAAAPDKYSEADFIAGEISRIVGGIDMNAAMGSEGTRAFTDIAIMCRTRRQCESISDALRREGIPCELRGRGDALGGDSAQRIIGLLRYTADPDNILARDTALVNLFRGNADMLRNAVDALCPRLTKKRPAALLKDIRTLTGAFSDVLDDIAAFHKTAASFLDALDAGDESDIRMRSGAGYASGAVTLMTAHASKGLEYPIVFLAGTDQGVFPPERADTDIDEERRLFYVAMTRARDELIITHTTNPSRFIGELPADVTHEKISKKRKKDDAVQLSFL